MSAIAEQQKKLVMGLASATFIGMPAIAWLIAGWTDVSMADRLRDGIPIYYQLLFGAVGGLFIGVIAQWFVDRSFMQEVTSKYMEMIGPLALNRSEMLFISLSAGIGEELLFRGAVQPLIGIWPTAVLFIALHGYLSFKSWRISLYGLLMTGMIGLMGYATEYVGIWSAVAAHTVVDIYLLQGLVLPDHLKQKS